MRSPCAAQSLQEVEMTTIPKSRQIRFSDSWAIRAGLLLLILGTGPLLAILLAASLGLTNDPNPNPIGPGLLAFFTFWPSVALIVVGVAKVLAARQRA